MSRVTANLSAAALITLGSLTLLSARGFAQGTTPTPPPPVAQPAPPPAATPAPTGAPAAEAPKPATPPAAAPAAEAPKPSAPAATAEPAKPAAPAGAAPAAPAPGKADVAPPEEVDLPERPVLSVEGTGTWDQAEDKLGGAFEQLAIAAKKAGIRPAGAPLVQYVESDDKGFSFMVMLPVDKAPAKGKLPKGIKAAVSPSGPALRFSPSVAADDLDEVYARIDAYLAAKGLTLDMVVEEYGEDAIASPEDRVVVDIYVFVE